MLCNAPDLDSAAKSGTHLRVVFAVRLVNLFIYVLAQKFVANFSLVSMRDFGSKLCLLAIKKFTVFSLHMTHGFQLRHALQLCKTLFSASKGK